MTAMNTDTSSSTGSPNSSSNGSSKNAVGIKETITSLIIAFMLAFLFRGFVIEGFQIPTGSMAPTLMGKHIRFVSPYSGYDWSVGPWTYADRSRTRPVRQQDDIKVNDPMSGLEMSDTNRRLAAGDRVFVLKYLPFLQSPKRWDVVVFKNPGTHENYIKRLVGMPGEQLAFVDGDVFARDFVEGTTATTGWDAWEESGWEVQRKSERVQRAMLQDVFNSRYVPAPAEPTYRSPFKGSSTGWDGVRSDSSYRYSGTGDTALAWNGTREITDAGSYNQTHGGYNLFESSNSTSRSSFRPFPVSDVAVRLNIEATDSAVDVSAVLSARGMEFRAVVGSATGNVGVEMRSVEGEPAAWESLDSGTIQAFEVGEIHSIEFWHIDQALWLFVDDKLVCGGGEKGAYAMTPAQRAVASTGTSWEALKSDNRSGDGADIRGVFSKTELYRKPTFRWDFSGGAFTLYNVSVQRDIAYQVSRRSPTRGGHPNFFPTLTDEEYFMCGDNSANSLDSRLWAPGSIQKWIEAEINDHVGTVHKDLVVGRAFLVYFPAPLDGGAVLTPDVGRMRWIW